MSSSDKIRKFERLVFKGVPEQPESVFERDGYQFSPTRSSGQSVSQGYQDSSENEEIVIGVYTYDFENEIEIYTSYEKDETH
jgi:hypothetical protein